MSKENVEIVRRVYDAAARRDSEAVLALYDPEIQWDNSAGPCRDLSGRRVYRGYEGLRTFFHEYSETWEKMEEDLEELIDVGDHVVSVQSTRVRGRGSGVEVGWKHNAGVWIMGDGGSCG